MSVDTKHPDYSKRAKDWQLMRDSLSSTAIKERTTAYLPMPSAIAARKDEKQRDAHYAAYQFRAEFPELVNEALNGFIGTMHRKPDGFKLPAKLDYLLERATPQGESLQLLLRRIRFEVLLTGRYGLAVDIGGALNDELRLVGYTAENGINWNETVVEGMQRLQMVVLDESGAVLNADGFTWNENRKRFRILRIVDGKYTTRIELPDGVTLAEDEDGSEINTDKTPQPAGGSPLPEIPFVFIGPTDLSADPNDIPMLPLARKAVRLYGLDADYRQSLYMTAQDTLVTKGLGNDEDGNPIQVGAGAHIDVPTDGDAKYIGVESQGIPEQRQAIQAGYDRAGEMSVRLSDGADAESGRALSIRVAAKTATLASVAMTTAAGVERMLKLAAVWVGANPDEVEVEPNLDFADEVLTGRELLELQQAKNEGAPISTQSIHKVMVQRGVTEMTFEEEKKLIDHEPPPALQGEPLNLDADEDEDE